VSFSTGPANELRVVVDDNRRYQHFFGVGTSVTGAWAQLMASLISHEHGIGLSHLRQPMGANDFSVGSYSLSVDPDIGAAGAAAGAAATFTWRELSRGRGRSDQSR